MTGTDEDPADEASVLSSLPATRPQRRSPKRDAPKRPEDPGSPEPPPATTIRRPRPPRTRRSAVATEPIKPTKPTGKPAPEVASASDRQPADDAEPFRATPEPAGPPVAAQGFEADPIQGTVNPPTGAELLASVAQSATELAEIAFGLTRRLARSVLGRLPRL